MDDYISELFLLLSVLGAPIILGALLFYGMTLSERAHQSAQDELEKAEEEHKRRAKDRAAGKPNRALDANKGRTGIGG